MGQVNELKDFTRGQLDAALMKIGQDVGMGSADGIRAFLAGELVVSKPVRNWRLDPDGTIRFSVTSDGLTGAQWADWFRANGYALGNEAEFMLRSNSFQPTSGVTYEIAVLPGKLWKDADRYTSNIRAEADRRNLKQGQEVNPEIACLIRRLFSNKEIEAMGLTWIIALHQPISGSGGDPYLLGARRYCGGRRLDADYGEPGSRWSNGDGFAAVVSPVPPPAGQVSPQVSGS